MKRLTNIDNIMREASRYWKAKRGQRKCNIAVGRRVGNHVTVGGPYLQEDVVDSLHQCNILRVATRIIGTKRVDAQSVGRTPIFSRRVGHFIPITLMLSNDSCLDI